MCTVTATCKRNESAGYSTRFNVRYFDADYFGKNDPNLVIKDYEDIIHGAMFRLIGRGINPKHIRFTFSIEE